MLGRDFETTATAHQFGSPAKGVGIVAVLRLGKRSKTALDIPQNERPPDSRLTHEASPESIVFEKSHRIGVKSPIISAPPPPPPRCSGGTFPWSIHFDAPRLRTLPRCTSAHGTRHTCVFGERAGELGMSCGWGGKRFSPLVGEKKVV